MKNNYPYSAAKPRTKRSCFSLVEMLVVMAIIGILMGVGIGGYTVARRKLAQSATQGTLSKIKVGLESFKSKYGYYPQQAAAGPFQLDIVTLSTKTVGAATTNVKPDAYFEPKYSFYLFTDAYKIRDENARLISSANTLGPTTVGSATYNLKYDAYYVTDGWQDNAEGESGPYIRYICPGAINTSSFDLYSAGHDRKFGTSDDIYAK